MGSDGPVDMVQCLIPQCNHRSDFRQWLYNKVFTFLAPSSWTTQSHCEFIKNQRFFFGVNCQRKRCPCASSFDTGGFQLPFKSLHGEIWPISSDWLFDLAPKRVRVRVVVVRVRVVMVRVRVVAVRDRIRVVVRVRVVVVRVTVRVMRLSLFAVEGLHCNELKNPCVEWRCTRTPFASAVNAKISKDALIFDELRVRLRCPGITCRSSSSFRTYWLSINLKL